MKTVTILVFAVLIFCMAAQGQIPRTLSYQGVLTDNLGVPKPDGSYSITFRLYDALSSGTVLWTEAKTLQVTKGLFSTILGDQTVIPNTVIFDQPYWLSIQVAAEPELSPRIPLTAVGYSFSSMRAETSMVSISDTLWKKAGDNIYHMGGKVGIGTNTPARTLDVDGPVHVKDSLILGSATQNGRLRIHRSGVTNPLININTDGSYGGNISVYDEVGNLTSRIEGDNSGEGGVLTVKRDAIGNNGFEVNGNWSSTKSPHVSIMGANRSAIFNTTVPGNSSVVLPDSSISSDEILDEPGVAATQVYAYTFATNINVQQISSVTIDVPSPGKIILQATGYVFLTHTTGTDETANINIGTTATTNPYTYGVARFTIPSGLPTDTYRWPFSCYRIFDAPSAGPVTFYLVGQQNQVFSNLQCNYAVFTAIYYPTTYGSTPLAAPSSATQSLTPGPEENMTPDNVTYQTASEFKAYKKQVFQLEIDKLKDQVEKLEQKINDQDDN